MINYFFGNNFLAAVSSSANDLSAILLLVKITIVIAGALVVRAMLRRYSAALRHAVLGTALVAVPVVVVFHFNGPGWSLPELGSGFAYQEPEVVSEKVLSVPGIATTEPGSAFSKSEEAVSGKLVPISGMAAKAVSQEAMPFNAKQETANSMVVDRSAIQRLEQEADRGGGIGLVPQFGGAPVSRFDRGAINDHLPVWRIGLVSVWAIVSGLLILRLVGSWRILVRKVSVSAPLEITAVDPANHVIGSLVEAIERQGIELRVVQNDSQLPCAFGLLRQTILLPQGCQQWGEGRWQSVLLHESAHFRRHDCWTNLAAGIFHALLWWHPLMGRLVRELRIESELACDDQVLQAGVSRLEYADLLLEFASRAKGRSFLAATSAGMAGSLAIESRMRSVLSANTYRGPLNWCSLVPLLLVAIIGVIPIAAARLSSPMIQSAVAGENDPKITEGKTEQSKAAIPGSAPDQVDALMPTPFDSGGNPGPALVAEPIFQIKNGSVTILGRGSFEYAIRTSFGTAIVNSSSLSLMEPVDDDNGEYRITTIDGREFTGELVPAGGLRVAGWKPDKPELIAELSMDHLIRDLKAGETATQGEKPAGIKLSDGDPIWIRSIRNAPLVPGKISSGISVSGLSWLLRTPEHFVPGQKYPVLVLLHGKNDNSENYIRKVVTMWPEIADRFLLVGINGEKRSDKSTSDVPRYDYTYFNFRGRSDFYQGLPETNRDSPILVAETIAELRAYLPAEKILLVGHSSGGFVTASVLMNYPETIDGAVVVAGGLPTPSGPTGYRDVELRRLQRERPIVFVSTEDTDRSSSPGQSQNAIRTLKSDSFDKVHAINVSGGGDGFSVLPVDQGIEWVCAQWNAPNANIIDESK